VEALRLWALSAIRIGDQAAADRLIGILQSYNTPLSKRVSLFLEGFRYRLLGRLDEAEDKLTAAWKMNRNNPSINRELASLYCKQKRYAEAEVFARASYVVAPTNPYLLDIMAETLLGKLSQGLPVDLGELNRIFAALKRYGDAPGSSFYLIREAQRLVRERNLLEARRVIDKAIERTPALLSAHFIKSEICLEQNDVRGAERCASELNRLLTDLGGFSEGDEARLAELQVRIEINKSQFRMAKAAIERKAFLTDAMQRRLLSLLAKSISFDPSKADKDLQDWARQYRE
ncbi:tetratricopeptide repeat protein, partial [Pseudorhodoplanes sp.]|uniref:tetratricopeptide repeat protein n=1 Tax=Pseudorhodoplanes sp. TaxID=1934341 RepID=UPI003D0E1736